MPTDTLPSPARSLDDLAREERSFTFTHFTCEHAWVIGNILRSSLRTADVPAIIHISLSSANPTPQTLFHAPSLPGLMPDHETQISRKRATVLRWGHSTWYMACKFGGDQQRFREYYGVGSSGEGGRMYSCEGGGYPIFVKGVEGVVGAIVLAGLDGEEAHGRLVKAIVEYKELRNDFRSPMRERAMTTGAK